MNTNTNTEGKQPKCDEATLRRLANARLKGLETRRMKAELKKAEKEAEAQKLKQAYNEKVLKKTPIKKAAVVEEEAEETDKEIYQNQPTAADSESDADEAPVPKAAKPKAVAKKTPTTKVAADGTPMNYKQEYYRLKMMKIQQQDEQANYMQSYAHMPPQQHMVDIARNQLQSKVNKELMSRVYSDLFGC